MTYPWHKLNYFFFPRDCFVFPYVFPYVFFLPLVLHTPVQLVAVKYQNLDYKKSMKSYKKKLKVQRQTSFYDSMVSFA